MSQEPEENKGWEEEFDKRFVRDDGLMDKYDYEESGDICFMAESIKSFIHSTLEEERKKRDKALIEEIEKSKKDTNSIDMQRFAGTAVFLERKNYNEGLETAKSIISNT